MPSRSRDARRAATPAASRRWSACARFSARWRATSRLIVEGGPDLGSGSLAERRARFARDFDHVRAFAVREPRGYDALVGALLVEPVDPTAAAGLIFFNNVGFLGMCGHATIGAAVTLSLGGSLLVGGLWELRREAR